MNRYFWGNKANDTQLPEQKMASILSWNKLCLFLLVLFLCLKEELVECLICWHCDDGAGRCKGQFTPMEHQPVECDGKCVKIRVPEKQDKRVRFDYVDRRCLTKSQQTSLRAHGKSIKDGCRFMSMGWDKTRKAYYCFCSEGHFCNAAPPKLGSPSLLFSLCACALTLFSVAIGRSWWSRNRWGRGVRGIRILSLGKWNFMKSTLSIHRYEHLSFELGSDRVTEWAREWAQQSGASEWVSGANRRASTWADGHVPYASIPYHS